MKGFWVWKMCEMIFQTTEYTECEECPYISKLIPLGLINLIYGNKIQIGLGISIVDCGSPSKPVSGFRLRTEIVFEF
jgi:hypothetical protein